MYHSRSLPGIARGTSNWPKQTEDWLTHLGFFKLYRDVYRSRRTDVGWKRRPKYRDRQRHKHIGIQIHGEIIHSVPQSVPIMGRWDTAIRKLWEDSVFLHRCWHKPSKNHKSTGLSEQLWAHCRPRQRREQVSMGHLIPTGGSLLFPHEITCTCKSTLR